jgi:hypothetical protein
VPGFAVVEAGVNPRQAPHAGVEVGHLAAEQEIEELWRIGDDQDFLEKFRYLRWMDR